MCECNLKNTIVLEGKYNYVSMALFMYSVLGAAIVVIGFYAVIWGKSQEQAKEECEVYDSESYSPVVPLLKKKKMEE